MANEQFKYLDGFPVEENFINNPFSSLSDRIDFKENLNLAININSTDKRIAGHIIFIKSYMDRVKGQTFTATFSEDVPISTTTINFSDLNLALESYLFIVLGYPIITSFDKSRLSNHYKNYKASALNPDILKINTNTQRELIYTRQRNWMFEIGSLGYYFTLGEDTEHYIHPSDILHRSINSLINITKESINLGEKETLANYFQFLTRYQDLLNAERNVDVELYNLSFEIFINIPNFSLALTYLEFLENWMPRLHIWFEKYLDNPEVDTQLELIASNALRDIAISSLRNQLDRSAFVALPYYFAHLELNPSYYSFFIELLTKRKEINFNPDDSEETEAQTLLSEFINSISVFETPNLFVDINRYIINYISPPGGLNLYLASIGAALLNQAYILTHESNNPYKNYPISPYVKINEASHNLYGRTHKLLFLAGYCFKKMSLVHWRTLGNNLITHSALSRELKRVYNLRK